MKFDPAERALLLELARQYTDSQIRQKNIPTTTINLCDYGINVYQMLATGKSEGWYEIENTAEFWKKIPINSEPLALVTDDGQNNVIIDRSAMVVVSNTGTTAVVISSASKIINGSVAIDFWLYLTHEYEYNSDTGIFNKSNTKVYFETAMHNAPSTEVV